MKKLLLVAIGVLLVGLGVGVRPASAQATDPASVAQALINAENAHNVAGAVALFASDAVVTLPTGKLTTTAEIEKWQQELAAGNFHANTNAMQVAGDRVTFTGKVALDAFRKAGFATLDSMWDITVQQGKVKTFTFSFTPEAGAKLQQALALAATGIDLRDNSSLVVIAGALLAFGLVLVAAARPRQARSIATGKAD